MTGIDDMHRHFTDAPGTGENTVIPIGDLVACDACNEDFTNSDRSGGFLFRSYAYGPCCQEKQLRSIRGYGEEWNIRARCPAGMSFADWVRHLRGPDAAITITGGRP